MHALGETEIITMHVLEKLNNFYDLCESFVYSAMEECVCIVTALLL